MNQVIAFERKREVDLHGTPVPALVPRTALANVCMQPSADETLPETMINLLPNAGFELSDESGFAEQWCGVGYGEPGEDMVRDNEVTRTGAASLRLGFRSNKSVICASEKMQIKPDANYGLIWWVRTEGMIKGCIASAALQVSGQWVNLSPDTFQRSDTDWIRYSAVFTTPPTIDEPWLQLMLCTSAKEFNLPSVPEAYAWYDDVIVIEGRFGTELPRTMCPLSHGEWETAPELSDEFEGAALDSEKWRIVELDYGETSWTKENVFLKADRLHLKIAKQTGPPSPKMPYSGGYITSRAKVRYGYFEVKCRLPKALAHNAYWFWRYCGKGGYEYSGSGYSEIDVFEATAVERTDFEEDDPYFVPIANRVHSTLHAEFPTDRQRWRRSKSWQAPFSLDTSFHRYGLEWTPARLCVYVDDELVHAWQNTHHHNPLNLILSKRLEITSRFSGSNGVVPLRTHLMFFNQEGLHVPI